MAFITLKNKIEQLAGHHEGKVAIAIQTSDGEVRVNDTKQMDSASIIKVPLAMACLGAAEHGALDLHALVQPKETVGGAGVVHYLSKTHGLPLIDYLKLAMIVSDNTASNVLIDAIGFEQANAFSQKIGMKQTKLERHFMDFVAKEKGLNNVTTAADMLTCLGVLTKENEFLNPQSREILFSTLLDQQFKHKLALNVTLKDAEIILAHKTGEIPGIEHDIGIMSKGSEQIKVAILTEGFEQASTAQQFIGEIGRYLMDYLHAKIRG